jgi:hypothetical protein
MSFSLAHAKPSIASFCTSLADQLARGFQFADDQFQALQLQEQEAKVVQIQINLRNTIRNLMPKDQ